MTPRRLSVGLLHFTAPPVVGGVEAVLGHHARLLAGAGHRVRVITGRGGSAVADAELVRIPRADPRHPGVRPIQLALDRGVVPAGFAELVDALADELAEAASDLDVVVAHNVCSLNINVALTTALRRLVDARRVRLLAWDHDVAAASARYAERLHPGSPWRLFREAWPGVTRVAISALRRSELAEATGGPADAIRVIPNGVDADRLLRLAPTTRALLDVLALRSAWPVLLTPARLLPRKNLELAVAIVASLRRRGDDARVLITGAPDPHDIARGGYPATLRAAAAEQDALGGVHMLGDGPRRWRSDRVLADLYRIADALLLPSRDEGFGLPVLEAAANRLPVVCADIPALREIGGDDTVYVDPEGDADEAADAVRRLLAASPAARLAARVRAGFRWDVIYAAQIEPLLMELAA